MQNWKDSPNYVSNFLSCVLVRRFQWPRRLRRWSAAARLLGLRVESRQRNGYLSVVSVVCYQVEVCHGLINRPEKSYQVCVCVTECDQWIGKEVRLRMNDKRKKINKEMYPSALSLLQWHLTLKNENLLSMLYFRGDLKICKGRRSFHMLNNVIPPNAAK